MANYTFTSFDQSLGFGKYSELSMEEVLNDNPSYISWCIDNISEFCMSPELIDEIKTRFQNLDVPAEFEERFFDADCDDEDDDYDDYGTSYGEFEGSWARYSEEDLINDAFEGDPDLYWNIE